MATRVDFRRLDSEDKLRVVCEEVERLYESGRRVYVYVRSEEQCHNLDKLLWTFSQPSFIPHRMWDGESPAGMEPVLTGTVAARPPQCNVLVAADPPPLSLAAQFDEVVDFAETHNPAARSASRRRYAEYRNAGMEMYYHGEKK